MPEPELPSYFQKIVNGLVLGLVEFDEAYGKLVVSPDRNSKRWTQDGFIAAFAVAFNPPSSNVLIDAMPYTVHRQHGSEMLQIIKNNSTIVEHYKNKYLSVFHIIDRSEADDNCPFGSCGGVFASSQSGYLTIYVNYEKDFVAACFEQRFDKIYNCAGERLGLMSQVD